MPEPPTDVADAEPLSAFNSALLNYKRSMARLRDFFESLSPVVVDIESSREREVQEEIEQILREAPKTTLRQVARDMGKITRALQDSEQSRAPVGTPFIFSSPASAKLFRRISSASTRAHSGHHDLLNRSILVSLVTSFEVLVSEVSHARYRLYPDILQGSINVSEFRSFDSIQDALEHLAAQKVDELLRRSAKDWIRYFRDEVKVDLQGAMPDEAQWVECVQRRHLLIHTGGRVSSLYITNVDWKNVRAPSKKPALGAELDVDDDYLRFALDLFDVIGVLFCASVWRDLSPARHRPEQHETICHLVFDIGFEHLTAGRWWAASQIATWCEGAAGMQSAFKLNAKLNRLQAQKRLGNWDAARVELEAMDTSHLSPEFLDARAALLELPAECAFHAKRALAASSLTREHLREWPIFREIRDTPEFQKVLRSRVASKSSTPEAAPSSATKKVRAKPRLATKEARRSAPRAKANRSK